MVIISRDKFTASCFDSEVSVAQLYYNKHISGRALAQPAAARRGRAAAGTEPARDRFVSHSDTTFPPFKLIYLFTNGARAMQ